MANNDTQLVQARFDRAAAEWDANPGRVALTKGVVAAIREAVTLRPEIHAMDFGAGTGLITLGLLPYVGRITAVDASREMLRVLGEKLQALGIGNVQTLWLESDATPLPAAGFELVVSSMVLHHVADVPRAFQRLRTCLRSGGWIALADLETEDGTFHSDATAVFHHGFDRDEVCRWLQAAGFVKTAAREAYRMERPAPDGQSREYPVFLAVGQAE